MSELKDLKVTFVFLQKGIFSVRFTQTLTNIFGTKQTDTDQVALMKHKNNTFSGNPRKGYSRYLEIMTEG